MNFIKLPEDELIRRLKSPKEKVRMILDTDTYNEVDDQFALAYALSSPEHMSLEAVYAAPFHNQRSKGPEDGMKKSYEEILRILQLMKVPCEGMVYRGSRGYLKDAESPQQSEAANDLVKRAMACKDELLYVVAIGAITNIASAILMEPKIIEKIVVVWLGGNPHYWPHTYEFNLQQDVHASRIIFDCGVSLIQIPCAGVTTHLHTTIPELEHYLLGKSEIGTYLTQIVKGYTKDSYAWSKVIWDITTIAWLINSDWLPSSIVHSPILTDQMTYSFDSRRHFIRVIDHLDRDKIFGDLFRKLG
jgi:purine nucleosidase